ncbi:MAG: hypothetical protein WBG86_00120, partial [Polyangiales bacterium]
MVTPRLKVLACALGLIALLISCGESGMVAGSGGSPGGGGSGGMPDDPNAGVNCVEDGCNDGSDCTVDGVCESTTRMCVGRAPEPIDTPCGDDDLFVCDGEGVCVGCNIDAQCGPFFPDEECRVAPRCIENACPLPEPLADGTTCSTGECRAGVCSSPWAPKRQLVPMVCGTSMNELLFASPMDLTISPTPISSGSTFSATASASIRIPRLFLQDAVLARFPEPLETITLAGARAEVITTGVVIGGTVATSLAPLPQDITVLQFSNPGDAGGQFCGGGGPGCPLA